MAAGLSDDGSLDAGNVTSLLSTTAVPDLKI